MGAAAALIFPARERHVHDGRVQVDDERREQGDTQDQGRSPPGQNRR